MNCFQYIKTESPSNYFFLHQGLLYIEKIKGSSENDGSSDVYDRSEFKGLGSYPTAVTPTAVAPIAVILPVLT